MRCLITGSQSGLGKYLHREMGGAGFSRKNSFEEIASHEWDVIIHCAFNSKKRISVKELYAYFEDNLFFTKQLTSLPHKKFIFLSSIEVYPQTSVIHDETEIIEGHASHNMYPLTKLAAESLIQVQCPNHLILRAGALLGRDARPNSLTKILASPPCLLTLSAHSRFYYLLHSDILRFIKIGLSRDLQGIYNVVPNEPVTLGDVAQLFQKEVLFGSFTYDMGAVCNEKIKTIDPGFDLSSKEVLKRFAQSL